MCAGRVTNAVVWQVARAGDLADWLVRKSMMHPAMRDVPVRFDMTMGGWPDPTTRTTSGSFEPLTLQLQRAAYRRAITLVQCVPPSLPQLHKLYPEPGDLAMSCLFPSEMSDLCRPAHTLLSQIACLAQPLLHEKSIKHTTSCHRADAHQCGTA